MSQSNALSQPQPRTFVPSGPLKGRIRVPGDKSISHRALMLSALAIGTSRVEGLLEGEDVLATAAAMRALGAQVTRGADGVWQINGVGVGGLRQPATALDMGNSGTSTRLLMGLCASHDLMVTFTGDASLSARPMGRVVEPLSLMGASFTTSPGDRLPLMLRGIAPAIPIEYRLPVASAQVKSAILLAALNTPGITRVIEPEATRDHSERMLQGFGAAIDVTQNDAGENVISVTGYANLQPQDIIVPGDPSSAAFFIVAALVLPGSDLTIENVGMNATRTGLITLLREMGGSITLLNPRTIGGEPVADVHVKSSVLYGIDVDPAIAPSMIDEFPIFFIAAALAHGRTKTVGLEELRVKESDRLSTMEKGLARLGVKVRESKTGLSIDGSGGEPISGGNMPVTIEASLDHRIAMSFAIAGMASKSGVTVDDMSPVATSFPNFEALLAEAAG